MCRSSLLRQRLLAVPHEAALLVSQLPRPPLQLAADQGDVTLDLPSPHQGVGLSEHSPSSCPQERKPRAEHRSSRPLTRRHAIWQEHEASERLVCRPHLQLSSSSCTLDPHVARAAALPCPCPRA
eukprot:756256-Hanusia_phi.AAC.9